MRDECIKGAHCTYESYMYEGLVYHGVLPYAICRDDPEKKWRPH